MELDRLRSAVEGRTPGIQDARGEFAVLLALTRCPEGYSLLYEVRSDDIDRQPGEVCFPGGAMEPGETPLECALRETREELGIGEDMIDVFGPLDIFHPPCGIVIRPFLSVLRPGALETMQPCPAEVKETFLVPLSELEHPFEYRYPAHRQLGEDFPYDMVGIKKDYGWQPISEELVVYRHDGHTIWGFTALMTRAFMKLRRECLGQEGSL